MVTAKNQSEDVVKALDLGQRLCHEADRLCGRSGTHRHPVIHKRAQEGLRESEERYALAAVAPTMAFGTGIWRPMLCTSLPLEEHARLPGE